MDEYTNHFYTERFIEAPFLKSSSLAVIGETHTPILDKVEENHLKHRPSIDYQNGSGLVTEPGTPKTIRTTSLGSDLKQILFLYVSNSYLFRFSFSNAI